MISAVTETSEASIDEIKFQSQLFEVTKFSKEWKFWPKTHFLVFTLFVRNFSNKHHYILLKISRIFCFWYFCPKWILPKLFVVKVDLSIKVVALIKITTVIVECISIRKRNNLAGVTHTPVLLNLTRSFRIRVYTEGNWIANRAAVARASRFVFHCISRSIHWSTNSSKYCFFKYSQKQKNILRNLFLKCTSTSENQKKSLQIFVASFLRGFLLQVFSSRYPIATNIFLIFVLN